MKVFIFLFFIFFGFQNNVYSQESEPSEPGKQADPARPVRTKKEVKAEIKAVTKTIRKKREEIFDGTPSPAGSLGLCSDYSNSCLKQFLTAAEIARWWQSKRTPADKDELNLLLEKRRKLRAEKKNAPKHLSSVQSVK